MEISKILSFVIVVFFRHVVGKPQLDLLANVELEIGDDCELFDGSKGTCMIDRECPYILDLIRGQQKDRIRRCGFNGTNQIVCCGTKAGSLNTRSSFCSSSLEKLPSKPVRLEYHIIKGNQAEVSEFPFMAALGYLTAFGDFDFKCGGTLISDTFVMTAAHCSNRDQPKIVRLGKTSLRDDRDEEQAQDIEIKDIIVRADYSSRTKLNDIALLKLTQPAVLAHNVFPACLSVGNNAPMSVLTIIGFGKQEDNGEDLKVIIEKAMFHGITNPGSTSDWLMKAETSEIPLSECQSKYKHILGSKPLTESQLCAFNNTIRSDSCQGDSGGPIFYKKNGQVLIYGIVSYGIGCGSDLPSVYTKVDKYLDWIKEILKS